MSDDKLSQDIVDEIRKADYVIGPNKTYKEEIADLKKENERLREIINRVKRDYLEADKVYIHISSNEANDLLKQKD